MDRQSVGVNRSTEQLRPLVLSGAVGYWVYNGIALELEGGLGVMDDSTGALDVASRFSLGVNLRLESPPVEDIAAYLLFGYIRSSYELTGNGVDTSLSLPGGRLALGLTYSWTRNIVVDTSFTHHDYDDDTRINSFRFGVRYNVRSGG